MIPFIRKYHFEWHIISRAGFGLICLNNIHRKIFRINKGVDFPIHFSSTIIGFDKMSISYDPTTIGSFVLSGGCYFQALNGIQAGKNFLFASGIKIISSNHGENDRTEIRKAPPIIIGNNVWLGANVVLLAGISLGDNVIVGAGSVVTKSFPSDLTIAGNPARIIKHKEK